MLMIYCLKIRKEIKMERTPMKMERLMAKIQMENKEIRINLKEKMVKMMNQNMVNQKDLSTLTRLFLMMNNQFIPHHKNHQQKKEIVPMVMEETKKVQTQKVQMERKNPMIRKNLTEKILMKMEMNLPQMIPLMMMMMKNLVLKK